MNLKSIYKEIDGNFYDRQARSVNPLRKWFHVNRWRIINNLVMSRYRQGMRLVDLGCGSCNWNVLKFDVFGVDSNEDLLKSAKSAGRITDYKIADVCASGLAAGFFDMVVVSEVLEHIKDYDLLISEISRILKPGGHAIISVPFDTALSLWKYLFFVQCLLQGYIFGDEYYRKAGGHINHFSPDRLRGLFLKHDFDIELLFDIRRFTIFMAARKKPVIIEPTPCADLTVILPTLNEGPNIHEILSSLTKYYTGARIIVSDDGSHDGTKDIVETFGANNVFFLDRKFESLHGLTVSILDAIKLVKTKYFVVMDADGQHPYLKVGEMISSLRCGRNLSIGSRVKVAGNWPLPRKILSYTGTMLGKICLLARNKDYLSYDILSGFFGAETSFWNAIVNGNAGKFKPGGYKILFEFLKIMPKISVFSEVYYEFAARNKAQSKMNFKIYLEYLKSFFN